MVLDFPVRREAGRRQETRLLIRTRALVGPVSVRPGTATIT